MKRLRTAPTIEWRCKKDKKDFGIMLVDLHSQIGQVATCHKVLGDRLSREELRRGKPARWAFSQLTLLRQAISPNAQLRDVSGYYRCFAIEHQGGYWLHGFIDAHAFLDAIECGLNLALSGDADFTEPLRELNERFPYRPEQYRKGKRRAESAY